MFRFIYLFVIVSFLFSNLLLSQEKKRLNALNINEEIRVDGDLSEYSWKRAEIATNFIQHEPYNGKPANHKTEVKILFDNSGIYIGAKLYDDKPDSIYQELGKRDDADVNSDIFLVAISPYNDGLNAFGFILTAAGVQCDSKYSIDDEDSDWDAVWISDYKVNNDGWTVEMKIPYSAIRFPKKEEQVWGINFWRQVRRTREWTTWQFVDNSKKGIINQSGELTGIRNIQPPVRLSATPYVSSYIISESEKDLGYSFNGGMDLKYGVNESFTLDLTLIPDFGQIQSDDEVLNLSPFETFYGEKRPFFTEGTELFNKGDIFYSRRVGGEPYNYFSVYDSLKDGEIIIKNPSETKMINATKLSGRNKKGLGIGVFNGMTSNTFAEIEDSLGNIKRILTQPFTNYNMLVFDQSLKNNSFISLLTTNVLNNDLLSNVGGLEFEVNDKSNNYYINGDLFVSKKYSSLINSQLGKKYSFGMGKGSGKFQYSYDFEVIDDIYDQNDMGYLQNNNEFNNNLVLEYNIYKPFWKMMSWKNSFEINYSSLFTGTKFTNASIGYRTRTILNNYLFIMYNIKYSPYGSVDYYEPRLDGWYYKFPEHIYMNFWISPDYRKKFLVDINGGCSKVLNEEERYSIWLGASPRIRINNQMLLIFGSNITKSLNGKGYVNSNLIDSIYFGNRNQVTVNNTITTSYIFNNKSSINFRLRHYWSKAEYDKFYYLSSEGQLFESNYLNNHNISFNAFTIDLNYSWNFAPGSELAVVWKNQIYNTQRNTIISSYYDNLNSIFNFPQTNSLSLKILYYIDYQYLKNKKG